MIPMDLYTGPNYPYTCYLDFISDGHWRPLHSPSNNFSITRTTETKVKIWSEGSTTSDVTMTSTSSKNLASSSNRNSSPALSIGAIVGIVIAALVGGAGISGAAIFLCIRARAGNHFHSQYESESESKPEHPFQFFHPPREPRMAKDAMQVTTLKHVVERQRPRIDVAAETPVRRLDGWGRRTGECLF